MTSEERSAAVASYGFTTRQSAFLTTVMLHAGVCLPRQYPQFAGIAFGRTTRDLFERLIRHRFATPYPCWRGSGHLYHVHHKGLYRAIGEPDNRHRRRPTVGRAVERLMLLDAILAQPEITWLATEREKFAYFVHQRGLAREELPALVFEQRGTRTVRYFPDKLPVGLVPNAEDLVFMYVVTEPEGHKLQEFLTGHRALLQRLNRWTLRLVVPSFLATAQATQAAVMRAFVAAPVRPSVLDEFRWFCQARHSIEERSERATAPIDPDRYGTARRAFGAPRFYTAYRTWLKHGDTALNELLSPRLQEAWQRGDIRLEHYVLPHQYQHLASAVATA